MKCLFLVVLLFVTTNTKGEEDIQPREYNGAWKLPVYETAQNLASSAYSKLPSVQTVTSYLPESIQQYLPHSFPSVQTVTDYAQDAYEQYMPNQETIDSYIPSMDNIRSRVPSYGSYLNAPYSYLKRKIFGNYVPQKLLTEEERNRLIQALSDKLLKKDNGEEITQVLDQLAPTVVNRAQENMVSIVIRLVVHRVVHGMAVSYIGPVGAFLARKKIDALADSIADRAVAQYKDAGPNRIDLYSYLRQINWKAVYENAINIVTNVTGKKREEGFAI